MELIPATPELMLLELEDPLCFSTHLDALLPESWPPKLVGNLIDTFVIQRLRDCPGLIGWSYWYWLLGDGQAARRYLMGRSHFSPPGADGTVEIAYEVLEQFRGMGFGAEGVRALTEWALSHPGVIRVIADAYSTPSERVLEKCGFTKVPADRGSCMTRFEILCSRPEKAGEASSTRDGCPLARNERTKSRSPWLRRWFGK
jgi:RimJ/RimL family protein N-acetyltransferase